MPRIAIALILSLVSSATAFAGCGERVQAYTSYEDYNDQMERVDGVSIFPLMEYSPHSAFEGLVISDQESPKTKVEIEVRKGKNKKARESFSFKKFALKDGFRATVDFDPAEFFGDEDGSYVLRLVLNGKTLCEEGPHEIQSGD